MIKEEIARGFARTLDSYSENATIQKQVSEKLGLLISNFTQTQPQNILEIGCGTGFLTSALLNKFPNAEWKVNDINKNVKEAIDLLFDKKANTKPGYIFGDAETIHFSPNNDLIVSSSCFQWFNNPTSFFNTASQLITTTGLFAFSTFGPENMTEIKSLCGQGITYLSKDEYLSMLSTRFEVIYQSDEITKLHFAEPCEVLKHMKTTGVNSVFRQHWTKARLAEFCTDYLLLLNYKGYPLTYHPMYFICKPL